MVHNAYGRVHGLLILLSIKQLRDTPLPTNLFMENQHRGICHIYVGAIPIAVIFINENECLLEFYAEQVVTNIAQKLEQVECWQDLNVIATCMI